VVKACNQIVVALVIEAVAEALVLGSRAGVVPDRGVEVLSRGLAANKVIEVKGEKVAVARLHPTGQGPVPPQGSGDSARGGQEVRGDAPCHGARGPDVRGPGSQVKRRLGPLGSAHPRRGGVRHQSNVTVASKSTSVRGVVNYAASGRTTSAPSTAALIEDKRTTSSGAQSGSGSSMTGSS
jgi:hypothetical protein